MASGKRVCSVMWKAVHASFGFALLHTVVGYLNFSGALVTCHDCNQLAARIFIGFDLIDIFHSVTGLLHCMYAFFFFFFYQLLLQCNIIFQLVFLLQMNKKWMPYFFFYRCYDLFLSKIGNFCVISVQISVIIIIFLLTNGTLPQQVFPGDCV